MPCNVKFFLFHPDKEHNYIGDDDKKSIYGFMKIS